MLHSWQKCFLWGIFELCWHCYYLSRKDDEHTQSGQLIHAHSKQILRWYSGPLTNTWISCQLEFLPHTTLDCWPRLHKQFRFSNLNLGLILGHDYYFPLQFCIFPIFSSISRFLYYFSWKHLKVPDYA